MKTSRYAALIVPALLLLVMSGCGGEERPNLTPDVTAERLDVAISDLEDLGVDEDSIDVLGGGTFGVIDESNWTVCEQKPAGGKALVGKVRLTVDRTCPDDDRSARPQESDAASEPPPAEEQTSGANESTKFTMPKLIGEGLQDAQDQLQSLGSFVLRQDDATGRGRFQVLDANWKVCTQKPRAGLKVPIDKLVVLAAVKLNESCP